jgi:2-amino-4-hydroxy-6-hydroxymethyldihydropteridine diphosphokinase
MEKIDLPNDGAVLAYLSLGSNLGDRRSNLDAVQSALPPEAVIRKASSIYETEPWGYLPQPDFLNQILLVDTHLSARDLLAYLKDLENWIGREPSFRYGPRLVDIDIIFYGDQIIIEPDLEIPHPRFQDRAFVLVPLAEISPNFRVPGSDQTISDLLISLDTSGVRLYQE